MGLGIGVHRIQLGLPILASTFNTGNSLVPSLIGFPDIAKRASKRIPYASILWCGFTGHDANSQRPLVAGYSGGGGWRLDWKRRTIEISLWALAAGGVLDDVLAVDGTGAGALAPSLAEWALVANMNHQQPSEMVNDPPDNMILVTIWLLVIGNVKQAGLVLLNPVATSNDPPTGRTRRMSTRCPPPLVILKVIFISVIISSEAVGQTNPLWR